eukprot:gnl/MRDRNA2_/MRDRNA2_32507_c0_seq2.p1 gnl/MRDRNA2_/MRDRNA2_32507_c0~~gnl/MRDRNA2_/MRDRNA2_32507_c0_seq2.p1  ORF type:complete len:210 (+),score=49.65 gnl/MRDRNA2_/MRDRNA2_32507_c0_seq2:186-815(+)
MDVIDALDEYMSSQSWTEQLRCFGSAQQGVFDGPTEEHSHQHFQAQLEFREMVDTALVNFISERSVSAEEFCESCKNLAGLAEAPSIAKVLEAVDNFVAFRDMMEVLTWKIRIDESEDSCELPDDEVVVQAVSASLPPKILPSARMETISSVPVLHDGIRTGPSNREERAFCARGGSYGRAASATQRTAQSGKAQLVREALGNALGRCQ